MQLDRRRTKCTKVQRIAGPFCSDPCCSPRRSCWHPELPKWEPKETRKPNL